MSSVVHLLKHGDSSLECSLLIRSNFMKNVTPELSSLYARVDTFEIPTLTFQVSKNPIITLKNVISNIKDTFQFKKFIRDFIRGVDIICISCFREYFANIMAKEAKGRAKLVALRMADQQLDENIEHKRRPILSFLLNIKNFLFGYSVMDYKWSRDKKNLLLSKNYVKYPYHRTISITDYDIGEKGRQNYRLPAPFVALKSLYKLEEKRPGILVAGDKTPFYEGWSEADQKKYQDFLDYLRENFKDYKLYFKPKAGKTDPSKFNLNGFQVLNPEISLEEFCLRKLIKKVISIMSTSSKVGAYFGIPSYVLYPIFDISAEFEQYLDGYFDDMRSVVRVKSLNDIKKTPVLLIQKYPLNTLSKMYSEAILL